MQGGQGEVKTQYINGQIVACKHPLFSRRDEDSINRFKREIRIAQKINSPNVIKIIDCQLDGDDIYYTMPLYEESLAEYLVREGEVVYKNLELQQKIMLSILSGVKALHDSEIIHRDLKPNNILLNGVDDIVVCDFGLSKDLESDSTFTTETGLGGGTTGYMSPEQLRDIKRVDFRTDIYALGAVFNDLIGRNNVYTETPRLLSRIADTATAHDKEDRFGDVSQFISAINAAYKILLKHEKEILVSELLDDISKKQILSVELMGDIEYILQDNNYTIGIAGELCSCLNDEQYRCFEESDEELCLDMFRHIWDEWINEWNGNFAEIDDIARFVRNYFYKSNSHRIKGYNLAKLAKLAYEGRRYPAMSIFADLMSEISDDENTQYEILHHVSLAIIKSNYKQIGRPVPTWV